jgi:alpha-tubulin suppressor-like RCC1 family protein
VVRRAALIVLFWLLLLAGVLSAAQASDSLALTKDGSVAAWGCGGRGDFGQCHVPASARRGVTAIAAGYFHSLALTKDGSVVAWGCAGGDHDFGQCRVPASARRGVTAIAAGGDQSLALKPGR